MKNSTFFKKKWKDHKFLVVLNGCVWLKQSFIFNGYLFMSAVCARGNSYSRESYLLLWAPVEFTVRFVELVYLFISCIQSRVENQDLPQRPAISCRVCYQVPALDLQCGVNKSCSASLAASLSRVLSRPGFCYLVSQPSSCLSTSALPGLSLFLLWLEIQSLKHL